ncbi:hypothetical protein GYMLUDRAFT_180219 [Collybiopsis luxurians FD-317 M1]|uniref:T6SS Phospholipase effector Tle1-like catalytic domain-containing protein n=1 Tax=Collybiopsis luxurians FD-317 M1 TaxID=944289 RepID=A0A0D0C3D6_9AGAR|nr:hypothetical protein GYMLUDRAFT_180219 [Collybiopsis luxurians FD-317 M1]
MAASNAHARVETGATLVDSPTTSKINGSSTVDIPDIIPPDDPSRKRTLVLCFDGTGDQFDADNSNVIEFFRLLKKDDRSKQMVYYQAGIGTYTVPQVATPLMAKFSRAMDEAIAWNLQAHVMEGYSFIMQNYIAGDRICIFGFSRGAYTARSLAGMIHKIGVLPADNHQQIPFAYKMYTQADKTGWEQSNAFKKAFSIDVDIEFLGVWDTVSSVGIIPRRLPFTTSNTIIRTFRHAVSLDERRAKFKANLWNRPNEYEAQLGTDAVPRDSNRQHSPHNGKDHPSKHRLERENSGDSGFHTDVLEVWFAGCHCDVGGGSVSNDTKPNLARIPLRWMIRECFKAKTGIMFHSELMKDVGLDPHTLYPDVKPRPPHLPVTNKYIQPIPSTSIFSKAKAPEPPAQPKTEEEFELADALCPVYDQLSLRWGWWILEFWPIKMRYQLDNNSWLSYLGWNLGRGRHIPKQETRGVKVHRSVKMRLDAGYEDGSKYVPKAGLDTRHVTWMD